MYEGPASACTYQNPLDLKRGLLTHNLQNKTQGLALGGGTTMMTSPLNIKSEEVVAPDWSACTYRFPGLASCAAGGMDPIKAVTSMAVGGRGDDHKGGEWLKMAAVVPSDYKMVTQVPSDSTRIVTQVPSDSARIVTQVSSD
ncbi:uncharacterized protein LOC121862747 [Homarus americanus]|uniref:uncharacterized protein LOC121862747 n=1 Tax=Homarus americanus TaxID=6706 RepID=UPI001C489587|nr:uncharacterized protein LOC121862747 [Homarus americanus]